MTRFEREMLRDVTITNRMVSLFAPKLEYRIDESSFWRQTEFNIQPHFPRHQHEAFFFTFTGFGRRAISFSPVLVSNHPVQVVQTLVKIFLVQPNRNFVRHFGHDKKGAPATPLF